MKNLKVGSSTLKKGLFCLFVPLQFIIQHTHAQASGYYYAKTVTVQGAQVSGTVANFPVLINVTDNSLRTVANGGHVQNANGYDIAFTLNGCGTILPVQIERYVPTTGEYVAWVQVPSLTNGTNTTLNMFYGNASISTSPSFTAVWDANYMGVWHFNNSVNDASSNVRNLTDVNTANWSSGRIGEGRRLNTGTVASNNAACRYLQLPSGLFSTVTNFTFEGWVYLDANTTNWERIFDFGRNNNINMFLTPSLDATTTGVKRFAITTAGNGSEERVSSGSTTATGGWHYFVFTINNSNNTGTLYYDGTVNATNTGMTLRPSDLGADNSNFFGRSQYNNDDGLYGKIDEFRISNTARDANWVTTSYRNQSSPSTFYNVSSEVVATSICSVLPVQLTAFQGVSEQDGTNTITWTTELELNHNKFLLERSANGSNWECIKTIPAVQTTSITPQNYMVRDYNPALPFSYYRLKQVDMDGTSTLSKIIAIKQHVQVATMDIMVRPNPAQNHVTIACANNLRLQDTRIELLNNLGMPIPVRATLNANSIALDMPGITNGVYYLNVYIKNQKYSRKLLIAQ
jgi:biopolymer transport protein ExbB